MKHKTQLIVALDTDSLNAAEDLISKLSSQVNYFKIGSQLFTACGPRAVELVLKKGAQVFLDLKYHDIPQTVANAAISALRLGVSMFNVHALGGKLMLQNLIETVNDKVSKHHLKRPIVLGVSVLTSLDRSQLNSLGIMRSVKNEVLFLAKLCKNCGLDGVVCSGKELGLLRRVMGDDFVLLVAGVRFSAAKANDQKRIITPKEAFCLGADYLVVGRPITASANPLESTQRILKEINAE